MFALSLKGLLSKEKILNMFKKFKPKLEITQIKDYKRLRCKNTHKMLRYKNTHKRLMCKNTHKKLMIIKMKS